MTEVNISRIEVEVNVEPTFVDLVLTGPGIQGSIGPVGPPGPTGPPGSGSGSGSSTLAALTDVDVTQKTNASVLYYQSTAGKFVADDINTTITLTDGGNF